MSIMDMDLAVGVTDYWLVPIHIHPRMKPKDGTTVECSLKQQKLGCTFFIYKSASWTLQQCSSGTAQPTQVRGCDDGNIIYVPTPTNIRKAQPQEISEGIRKNPTVTLRYYLAIADLAYPRYPRWYTALFSLTPIALPVATRCLHPSPETETKQPSKSSLRCFSTTTYQVLYSKRPKTCQFGKTNNKLLKYQMLVLQQIKNII